MRFKDLNEKQKDTVRLCAFVEEGSVDLILNLFKKYKGSLMDIVITDERAKELYFGLCLMNKHGLARRFLRELGLQDSISDYIQREYLANLNSGSLKWAPSAKDLQELIALYK